MRELESDKWGAASGIAAMAMGAAGGALEKGWPSASETALVAVFIVEHRPAILGQSFCFLVSSATFLWFIAALRNHLARAEGRQDGASGVVFGAGTAWICLSMLAQAFQIGIAMTPQGVILQPLLFTAAAVFGIANLPLAVMLMATAIISLRRLAFPVWVGCVTVVASVAALALSFGAISTSGPLAPDGWLTYLLYPTFLAWLVPTAFFMMKANTRPSNSLRGGAPIASPRTVCVAARPLEHGAS